MPKNAYSCFLSLIYSDDLYWSFGFSRPCLDLLHYIAAVRCKGVVFTVGDLMHKTPFSSPVPLHRNMYKLIDEGFLELVFRDDRRAKFVHLTPAADAYLARMDVLMRKALAKAEASKS